MNKDILNIDEVAPAIIEYSNLIYKNILDRLTSDISYKGIEFNTRKNDETLKIARNTRPIIFNEMKTYFMNNMDISLNTKKEILKQTIIDFFEHEDFYQHIVNHSKWNEIATKELEKIQGSKEYNYKVGVAEDLMSFLFGYTTKKIRMKRTQERNFFNFKVDINEKDYSDFVRSISKEIHNRVKTDTENIYGQNNMLSLGEQNKKEDSDDNEIKIDNIDFKSKQNKNTENIKQARKFKY